MLNIYVSGLGICSDNKLKAESSDAKRVALEDLKS